MDHSQMNTMAPPEKKAASPEPPLTSVAQNHRWGSVVYRCGEPDQRIRSHPREVPTA
jgi:hypothetical protein